MPAAPRSVIVSDRSIPLIRDPDPAGSRPPVFIHISTTPAHAFRAMTTDATSSQAGSGRIALQAHGKEAAFAELSCTYPLKLLSPRTPQDGIAVVYMLTYGGGLVSGDRIALSVDVGARTTLMLLSQVGVFSLFSFFLFSFEAMSLNTDAVVGIDQGVQDAPRREGVRPTHYHVARRSDGLFDPANGRARRGRRAAPPLPRPGDVLPRGVVPPSADVPPPRPRVRRAPRLAHVRPPRARRGMGVRALL